MFKIGIVDDHSLFAEALKNVLPIYCPVKEIECFAKGEELMTFLETHELDVVLLDLGIRDGMNGFVALEQLKTFRPQLKSIVVTMHEKKDYMVKAQSLGANAFLSKDCGAKILGETIQKVMSESQFIAEVEGEGNNPFNMLSKTELIVCKQLLMGKSNSQIAADTFKATTTIDSHRKNIYRKLEVNSIVEFIKLAVKHGMLNDVVE